MHIIARPKLREFQEKFSDAAASLERWYTSCRENQFKNFPELKLTFKAADLVGKCVVFNIRGNKYRLLVRVNFRAGRMWIKDFLPHREYDKLNLKGDARCS